MSFSQKVISFIFYIVCPKKLHENTIIVTKSNKRPASLAVKSNAGAIVAVWAPIVVVSFCLSYSFLNNPFVSFILREAHVNWLIILI